MGTANLPARQSQTSDSRANKIRKLLEKGYTPQQISRALAKRKMGKYRILLSQAYQLAGQNKEYQALKAAEVKGHLLSDIDGIASGLLRRARTGRPDAVKLALEVTGIHNPRMQHEHSGDIAIHLELPRPKAIDVPEAEVVEDS
jgi:hypothetical protein